MEAQVSQFPSLSSSYLSENRKKTWAFAGSYVVINPLGGSYPPHPCVQLPTFGARGQPSYFWIWASQTGIQIRTLPVACSMYNVLEVT